MVEHRVTEQAKEILGENYLGWEAIEATEKVLRGKGFDVEFIIDKHQGALRNAVSLLEAAKAPAKVVLDEPIPSFPYSVEDLQAAKENGEMLLLRPQAIRWGEETHPVTLMTLEGLFARDPLGKLGYLMQDVARSMPSNDLRWYRRRPFANEPGEVKPGWALVRKEILEDSHRVAWVEQEPFLQQYADKLRELGATSADVRRRTATESFYDTVLYYIARGGERLLQNTYDWGQTVDDTTHIWVGNFWRRIGAEGIDISGRWSDTQNGAAGVCPTR